MSKLTGLKTLSIKKNLLEPFKGIKPINVKDLLVKHLSTQMAGAKMKLPKMKGFK